MAITPSVRHALALASSRAKLLFDTYHWTWSDSVGVVSVPSVKEIEETYLRLASSIMSQKEGTNPEANPIGNANSGRLRVEYVDEVWTFSVDVGWATEDDVLSDEDSQYKDLRIVNQEALGVLNPSSS